MVSSDMPARVVISIKLITFAKAKTTGYRHIVEQYEL